MYALALYCEAQNLLKCTVSVCELFRLEIIYQLVRAVLKCILLDSSHFVYDA